MKTEICLSPGCALCAGRRLVNDPRGWLPHPVSPGAAARLLAQATQNEREAEAG